MAKEYIERDFLIKRLEVSTLFSNFATGGIFIKAGVIDLIEKQTAADVVEVVRCKDCKWFMPKHVLTDSGERRPYTEEEKKLPLGVTGDKGINCGSRCCRYMAWENNRVPVYVQENDFCSYGERMDGKGKINAE